MRRRRSLRLSTRATLSFGIIALLAGLALATLTYLVVRTSLIDQRESSAEQQAFANAQEIVVALGQPDPVRDTFNRLPFESDGFGFLTEPRLASQVGVSLNSFPAELRSAVIAGGSGKQQYELDGRPYLAVGVHIEPYGTGYFEAFPMTSTERTLQVTLTVLAIGAAATTLFATFFGWRASRRLLRPLSDVADAAGDIASGSLGARLAAADDPDLDRLAGSFNEMADAIQRRIEREQRFASDVSHELRSPITALSASVEVLDARRSDLPERTRQALDIVVGQVRRFDAMVLDLLELSRIDAGADESHPELVDLAEFSRRVADRFGYGDLPIVVERRAPARVAIDKFSFERILGNLLDNASTHGGGPVRVVIARAGRNLATLAVEDAGPGVAPDDRELIFERFARGGAARHRIGTGLGLALVREHAEAMGGAAHVEDRRGGGARFVITFPTDATPTEPDDTPAAGMPMTTSASAAPTGASGVAR